MVKINTNPAIHIQLTGTVESIVTTTTSSDMGAAVSSTAQLHRYSIKYQPNFKHALKTFQNDAIWHIEQGHSTLVTAPTGSGKTVIAYAAMMEALKGKRTFIYTAPLKAISEQKLEEFREEIAAQMLKDRAFWKLDSLTNDEAAQEARRIATKSVGLITGDRSINSNAPIKIMTTEIYNLQSQSEAYGESAGLGRDRTVVFDEFHNLGDSDRGYAWEESLMFTPPEAQIVALSATAKNANQLLDWINYRIHINKSQKIHPVHADERERPVQLKYFSFNKQVTDPEKMAITPFEITTTGSVDAQTEKTAEGADQLDRNVRLRGEEDEAVDIEEQRRKEKENFNKQVTGLVQVLQKKTLNSTTSKAEDKLPVLFFILNREACDSTAQYIAGNNLNLLTPTEQKEVNKAIDKAIADDPILILEQKNGSFEPLRQGVAAHHAEHLPGYKKLVEKLFAEKLIKVVTATSTLAAGINMPARTTVITDLYNHAIKAPLTVSEVKQMAGRAGRGGLDTEGNVIFFCNPGEEANIDTKYIKSEADPINSTLKANYLTLLNLIDRLTEKQKNPIELAKSLKETYLNRSFMQFQGRVADLKVLAKQYDLMLKFLTDLGYISKKFELTDKGKIAKEIKFSNPILITEFLFKLTKFINERTVEIEKVTAKAKQDRKAASKRGPATDKQRDQSNFKFSASDLAALTSCFIEDGASPSSEDWDGFIEQLNTKYNKGGAEKQESPLSQLLTILRGTCHEFAEQQGIHQITDNNPKLAYANLLAVLNWVDNGMTNPREGLVEGLQKVLSGDPPGKVLKGLGRTLKLLEYLDKAQKLVTTFPALMRKRLLELLPEDPQKVLFARGVLQSQRSQGEK